jgi:ribosomal protein L31
MTLGISSPHNSATYLEVFELHPVYRAYLYQSTLQQEQIDIDCCSQSECQLPH